MSLRHGTNSMYTKGACRCDACRLAARENWQRYRRTKDPNYRPRNESNPELTAAWKFAHARGLADVFADRIVATRPIPPRLLAALGLSSYEEIAT